MKAELKSISSTDIDERVYWPDDVNCFGFSLDAIIGPVGEDTGNLFQFFVCTPTWVSTKMINRDFGDHGVFGRYLIIVLDYDFERIRQMVSQLCDETKGKDWSEIAIKLSRYAAWEYAEYQT